MSSKIIFTIVLVLMCFCCHSAFAINCYQCDSNVDLECSEYFDQSTTKLKPLSCDYIHEARFCIKTTGMYGGRIGTIRNCSARDLGDYCTYIDRTGDIRYTRSCIYTCSSHGCNGAHSHWLSKYLAVLIVALTSMQLYWQF